MVQVCDKTSSFDVTFPTLVRAYFLRYPNPLANHVLSVDVLDRQILPKLSPSYFYSNGTNTSNSTSSTTTQAETPKEIQDEPLVLRTTRLILKRGTLPTWAPKGVIKNTLSWVLEESEVELDLLDSLDFTATSSLFNSNPQTSSNFNSDKIGDATLDPPEGIPGRTMRVWTRNLDHTTAMAVTEGILMKESLTFDGPSSAEESKGKGKEDLMNSGTEARSNSASDVSSKAYSMGQVGVPVSLPHTMLLTTGHVESQIGFSLLRRRIEKFGVNRVGAHTKSSRDGILHVISHLQSKSNDQTNSNLSNKNLQYSKRRRLLAALRPPFLDGYPESPLQRLKDWWRGIRERDGGNQRIRDIVFERLLWDRERKKLKEAKKVEDQSRTETE